MGAGEETGCSSSPALAAAAHRLLRARSSAGRAAGSALGSRAFSPGGGRGRGGGDTPGTASPERLVPHFFPAPRAPRDQLSTRSLPLKSRRRSRSLPCARPPAPARSRSRVGTHGSGQNRKRTKTRSRASLACGLWGPPLDGRQGQKDEKKGCPPGETSISSFERRGPRINFLWPTCRPSSRAARTLD